MNAPSYVRLKGFVSRRGMALSSAENCPAREPGQDPNRYGAARRLDRSPKGNTGPNSLRPSTALDFV